MITQPLLISGEREGFFGMPSLGSIKPTSVAEATDEVRAFALAFKSLIPRILPGATMAEKARALTVSPSLLSHWLHGRRLPRPGISRELEPLARGGQEDEGGQVRRELAHLEELLRVARNASCRRCAGGCIRCRKPPEGDRRNGAADHADKGDRRNSDSAAVENSTLPGRLAALPPADRAASLWSLGATLGEGEIGALAAALGRARMHSEMEVILRSAESAGKDSVKIALAASRLP